MAIKIIHGENTVQSRQKLTELETTAKSQGKKVIRLEAKSLTLPWLEEATQGINLFEDDQVIVIEELHSLPKSARQTQLLDYVTHTSATVILWEKRALTKTMLKKMNPNQEWEFKLSSSLFKWLDSLSPRAATKSPQLKLLHAALIQEDEQLCFLMLIRQVRLLIQVKEGGLVKGAPFMITKLKKQAADFSTQQLLTLHRNLLEIDQRQKTSQAWSTLSQELDLLLLGL